MNRPSSPTRLAAAAALAAALAGCAPMHVSSFVERAVDLRVYRTFDWATSHSLATGDPRLDNNPFFLKRLRSDVEKELVARGFERVTTGTPDLFVHYHVSVAQQIDVTPMDRKYGVLDESTPSVYDAGTLVLDFVDARTNGLVFRGWADGSVDGVIDNQARMEKRLDEVVARILSRFPARS